MRADHAIAYPTLARRVAASGHEVGVHGFRHERLTELGFTDFRRETVLARRELRGILGAKPRWFRPPFGAQNIRTFFATRIQGMDVAVWENDISDAMSTEGIEIAPGPLGSLTLCAAGIAMPYCAGSILLLHDTPAIDDPPEDASARKIALIDRVLAGIDSVGGRVVTLSELLRHGRAEPSRLALRGLLRPEHVMHMKSSRAPAVRRSGRRSLGRRAKPPFRRCLRAHLPAQPPARHGARGPRTLESAGHRSSHRGHRQQP